MPPSECVYLALGRGFAEPLVGEGAGVKKIREKIKKGINSGKEERQGEEETGGRGVGVRGRR